jgi:hypothetical protein
LIAGIFSDLLICLSLDTKTNATMSKKIKAFLYNLISFVILFVAFLYIIQEFTKLTGFWVPVTAFVVMTLVGPKFRAVQTKDGEKLFVKWLFIKGVKEIK